MGSTLVSGPPASGKSQRARELLAAAPRGVIIEFQPIYAMLVGQERSPATGRYPPRPEERSYALGLSEYIRRAAISGAIAEGLDVIATQTSGEPERRAFLLSLLGEGSVEEVLDPGRAVVENRLRGPDGVLSDQCGRALDSWYIPGLNPDLRSVETLHVEVRQEASELVGVVIAEGRAASGGRKEVFAPGSAEWPEEGIEILPEHRGQVETMAQPERAANGEIQIRARLTDGLRQAFESGRRWLSVEFQPLQERTVKGGVREIQRAMIRGAALVRTPEYDTATAELRTRTRRRRRWL